MVIAGNQHPDHAHEADDDPHQTNYVPDMALGILPRTLDQGLTPSTHPFTGPLTTDSTP